MKGAVKDGCSLIRCASDPDSLDGVLFENAAIFDGTAPHTLDPAHPGADGEYISLPVPRLPKDACERIKELDALSQKHRAAARKLAGAAALLTAPDAAREHFDEARLIKRVRGILERELPSLKKEGRVFKRFSEGYTPKGRITLYHTHSALCERAYYIEDEWGLSGGFMKAVVEGGIKRGCDAVLCFDPLLPSAVREIVFPEAGLCFIAAESENGLPDIPRRRIRTASCLEPGFSSVRGRLRLNRRIKESMTRECCSELEKSKKLHDEIEDIYRPFVDFEAGRRVFSDKISAVL
jgi:hypothetical protein